jgi:hypothetical protein
LFVASAGCGPDAAVDSKPVALEPERLSLHRLNRVEYNNTVRDLLGTELTPADLFPADDVSHGFDNIADVLSLSPAQVEMYHQAAADLVADAMAPGKVPTLRLEAETLGSTVGAMSGEAWKLVTEGEIVAELDTAPGTYEITVLAWTERVGPTPIRMALRVDGKEVQTFDVLADATRPGAYRAQVDLAGGDERVEVAYLNDRDTGSRYRNLLVDSVTIEGPRGVVTSNPLRERIMICLPTQRSGPDLEEERACAQEIIAGFGQRAWRRPLESSEVEELVAFAFEQGRGDDFAARIGLALRAILASPQFIFRIETFRDPAEGLDDYELASRLSYFLWSTMPDDALFATAQQGKLNSDEVLSAEVARMLADPKADAFVENFVGQWLSLRGLDEHEPDRKIFPAYDLALKNDMVTETESLFRTLLDGNRPVRELLTASFTFTNSRLGAHYGLEDGGEDRDAFARTALPPERAGILGHASILTVTSHPTRTSAVKRGKWVLEQLLCSGPPPPPPGVEGLASEPVPSATLRERMEQHRSQPICAACHTMMDPIGFGLENYDGTGKWRERDGEFLIDASGTLPDGEHFEGGVQLAVLLADDPRFPRCMATKMYTYALGRAPDWDVAPFVANWTAAEARLGDLVRAVAMSQAFRQHGGKTDGG